MLVAAAVLLAPLVFVTGTSLGRAFGRTQAFEEAAALLRFDAAQAAAHGHREHALLLRREANRVRSTLDGAPHEEETAGEPMAIRAAAGEAGSRF
jgi:hypothetical protein